MLSLWQSLNWPQALLLAVTVVGISFGVLPVLIRRIGILAKELMDTLIILLGMISPAAERRIRELMAGLRKQRLQLQKMRRRAKRHAAREEAAA